MGVIDDSSDLSSELSDALSDIEEPPSLRLTPPLSQSDSTDDPSSAHPHEDMPPARKRRKVEPKERTTRRLNLDADFTADSDEALDMMLKALRKRRKIVVVAGAGISVSAGIPDFRSSGGLFRTLKEEHKLKASGKQLFDASVYKDNTSTASFHDMVRSLSDLSAKASPTPFHRLLARLAKEERLLRLYTQNVDGLELVLPPLETQIPLNHKGPWPRTVQLHGGLEKMVCHKCQHISPFNPDLFNGPVPPTCPECEERDSVRTTHAGKRSHGVGRLRPRMVLYNEQNPDEDAIGAVVASDLRARPDAVIVVGTSLKIPPVRRIVKEMCLTARGRQNGITMMINKEVLTLGKDLEDCFDVLVEAESDEVARMINLKEWDDDSQDSLDECTISDVEKAKTSSRQISVRIETPKKTGISTPITGLMTPPISVADETDVDSKAKINLKTALQNPASQGRSITDVLKGDNKENRGKKSKINGMVKKAAKNNSKVQKASQAKKPATQAKLTGKITKSAQSVSIPIKTENKPVKKEAAEPASKPLDPIPPQDPRNNPPQSMFPNLALASYGRRDSSDSLSSISSVSSSICVTSPLKSSGPDRTRTRETVSPPSKPRGMGHLVD